MKIIRIQRAGNYTHHGIGYTEHDGYGGTADNRMSYSAALAVELRCILPGEEYQVEINGRNKGTFRKATAKQEV